jgi:hypothetical protein
MKVSCRRLPLPVIAVTTVAMMAGCPLPFDYKGPGPGTSYAGEQPRPRFFLIKARSAGPALETPYPSSQ